MKKRKIANAVMTAIIVLILAAGILGVGYVQGWFDKNDGSFAQLEEIRGIVNIERNGISCLAAKGMILRNGDKLTCNYGATATVQTADGNIVFSNSTQMEVQNAAANHFAAHIYTGEVFISTVSDAVFTFEDSTVQISDAVAMLSVRSGAQTLSVFFGKVGEAEAGQMLNWISGEKSISKLPIQSLNEFAIMQLRKANQTGVMCFADAQLDQLEADRWAEKQEQIMATAPPENTDTPDPDNPAEPTETTPTAPAYDGYCTVTIRCDTILNNWDDLEKGKAEFVPYNGVILPVVQVGFYNGETVFHVLERVCRAYGIQLEYSWTPMYNSYYIEGIHHLYEFDCGYQSGWMYKVNGWFPNYGCSSYFVKDGDGITWCYTCEGLGADVGAERME